MKFGREGLRGGAGKGKQEGIINGHNCPLVVDTLGRKDAEGGTGLVDFWNELGKARHPNALHHLHLLVHVGHFVLRQMPEVKKRTYVSACSCKLTRNYCVSLCKVRSAKVNPPDVNTCTVTCETSQLVKPSV